MNKRTHTSTGYLTQIFLLLVLVVPSLVPTGYMVKRDAATNLVEVVICSGVNHRNAWVDVNTGQYYSSEAEIPAGADVVQEVDSQMCPFAVASAEANARIDLAALGFLEPEVQECCLGIFKQSDFQIPAARAPPTLS